MKRIRTDSPEKNTRGGATLTEVLISILCMGIGVVAVASLFPIALLRSVEATQLTSGTILRFNAETLIDLYKEVPPAGNRNLVLNPDFDNLFDDHFNRNYLIDPLGAMIVRGDNSLGLNTTDNVGRLERFDALRIFYDTPSFTEQEAEDIVTLPDSWVTMEGFDDFPASNDDTSLTLSANTKVNLTELLNMVMSGTEMRVVLFSNNGRMSEVRPLVDTNIDVDNGTVSWTTPLPDNGAYFGTGSIGQVRFEYKERRYTWLLTVRNDTPLSAVDAAVARARVDVVIFFRRSPSFQEEIPYVVTGSGRNYTVSKIPQDDWNAAYPSTAYPSPYPDPFLKKGGFMLDTDTGTWHRLQKVNDLTQSITLERNTRTLDGDHAVFMRGVVDVYPLGSKP